MTSTLDLTDELLSAYLDGELDADTKARIEQALGNDAGARVRLERMQAADARLREDFKLGSSADDKLAQAILHAEPLPSPVKRPSRIWPAVLAAGIAGIVVGFAIAPRSVNDAAIAANRAVDSTLSNALETFASGARSDSDRIEIVLTFKSQDGRFCRLFRSPGAEGLACRESDAWRMQAWDGTVDNSNAFRAAGASEIIDNAMDRLGGGAALDPTDEAALIARKWQPR